MSSSFSFPPNDPNNDPVQEGVFADPSIKTIRSDALHMKTVKNLMVFTSCVSPMLIIGTATYVGGAASALYAFLPAAGLALIVYNADKSFIYEALATRGVPELKKDAAAGWRMSIRAIPPFAVSAICLTIFVMKYAEADIDRLFAAQDAPVIERMTNDARRIVNEADSLLAEPADADKRKVLLVHARVERLQEELSKDQSRQREADETLRKATEALSCESGGGVCANASGFKGFKWRARQRQIELDNAKASLASADDRVERTSTSLTQAIAELGVAKKDLAIDTSAVLAADGSRGERIQQLVDANPEVAAIRAAHGPLARFLAVIQLLASPATLFLALVAKLGIVSLELLPLVAAMRLPGTTVYGPGRTAVQADASGIAANSIAAAGERIFAARQRTTNARRAAKADARASRRFAMELWRQTVVGRRNRNDRSL